MSKPLAQLPNSSLSTDIPLLQFAWDSTSLGALKTCPRYYQYAILEGWQSRVLSVHLKFGQVYHGALELFYRYEVEGRPYEEGLAAAVDYTLRETWDYTLGRPWSSDHKSKNRETLLRTVVWYLDQFHGPNASSTSASAEPMATAILANGQPAVELSFRFVTDYTLSSGEPILWCGHLDRIVEWNDNHYIMDHKTTTGQLDERFFDGFSPDNQFSGYTFAGQIVYHLPLKGIVVNGAQIAVTFSRFRRQIVMRHQSTLDEWYQGVGYWISQAEEFATRQYWPMNEKSCGNYGGCPFRRVCAMPPSTRQQWLESDFTRRVWDPLKTREVI